MLKLDKNKKYLLACSYGPDSMSLFSMLLKEGYLFEVAHVNYHFRKESDYEEKSLRDYCLNHSIKIHVLDNKIKVTSNLEEKAREIRYNFFADLICGHGYDYLLVAHNKDDVIETYLLQKQRKNLPISYGIKSQTMVNGVKVVRPLLDMYKANLLDYCDANHVPYSIDQTNLENTYQRNKIRNEVLSKLTIEEKEEILKEINLKNKELDNIECKLNDIDINNVDSLLKLDEKEFAYALVKLVRKTISNFECSLSFTKEIYKVCKSNKSNVNIPLKNGYFLCKEYSRLDVRRFISFEPIIVTQPCVIDNEIFYFDLVKAGEAKGINKDMYPLTIRPYQKGDRYLIKGYEVSVNRLFIDWKMPTYLRKIWPIFVHNNVVIYIPRYRNNFDIKDDVHFYVKNAFSLKKD